MDKLGFLQVFRQIHVMEDHLGANLELFEVITWNVDVKRIHFRVGWFERKIVINLGITANDPSLYILFGYCTLYVTDVFVRFNVKAYAKYEQRYRKDVPSPSHYSVFYF